MNPDVDQVRVLHMTQTPVARDPRVINELDALGQMDHVQLHAFGAPAGGPPPASVRGVKIRQFDLLATRLHRLPRPVRLALQVVEMNWKFSRAARRLRPDVVHCHDTLVLPSGVLTKVLGGAKCLIYDAHELESDKGGQSPILSRATLAIEKLAWPWVDALISVSPSILRWYHEHFDRRRTPKPELCLVNTPNLEYSENEALAASVLPLKERLGLPPETAVLVFVGALVHGRGIELLLRASSRLMGTAHIAFVGYGPLSDTIARTADQNENVHLCDPVVHREVVPLIKQAEGAFCLIEDVSLSDYYCLPNKLFEYATAGLPILASRLPEIERVVTQYGLGYCIDMDEDAVLTGVRRVLEGGNRPIEQSDLGDFGWETQGEKLRQLYSRLIGIPDTPDASSEVALDGRHTPKPPPVRTP